MCSNGIGNVTNVDRIQVLVVARSLNKDLGQRQQRNRSKN